MAIKIFGWNKKKYKKHVENSIYSYATRKIYNHCTFFCFCVTLHHLSDSPVLACIPRYLEASPGLVGLTPVLDRTASSLKRPRHDWGHWTGGQKLAHWSALCKGIHSCWDNSLCVPCKNLHVSYLYEQDLVFSLLCGVIDTRASKLAPT